MNESTKEPEEYVSDIKYLAELIQMDLNFGRVETIPARAAALTNAAIALERIYIKPLPIEPPTKEQTWEKFKLKCYSTECPTVPGLYMVACGEMGWVPDFVAITRNDYQILIVHCADIGQRPVEQYHANLEGTLWLRVA